MAKNTALKGHLAKYACDCGLDSAINESAR